MACGWVVTVMWYGRKIEENTQSNTKFHEFMFEQVELNGKIIMYIELTGNDNDE